MYYQDFGRHRRKGLDKVNTKSHYKQTINKKKYEKFVRNGLTTSLLLPIKSYLYNTTKNYPYSGTISDCSKQTSIEIEQLNARVVEAETKLKSEVARIKKKLQIQITELEMSLDAANKTNIDLQKTIKKQSLTLTELQAHYDEVQRQLSVTLDQLSISQRRVQALTAEVEEIRGNYEAVSVSFLFKRLRYSWYFVNNRPFAAREQSNCNMKNRFPASTN